LKARVGFQLIPKNREICVSHWRRRPESNEVFTDCQPQYPDLQRYFNTGFTGVQALYETIRHIPDLTRHTPAAYSVIEGFVEGFLTGLEHLHLRQNVVAFRHVNFPRKNSPLRGLFPV
jgi:hypothetical protein